MRTLTFFGLLIALALVGCDSTAPAETAQVAVKFEVASSQSASKLASTAAPLTITQSNGTLTLSDIRMIVAEFELDRLQDDDAGKDTECKFEAPPFFLDLPLESGAVTVAADEIPLDLYKELEFEVEDLSDDKDDSVLEQQQRAELWEAIQAEFPDWPREASMLGVGTFTPTGGEPQPFRVYFDAEIEVERAFAEPLDLSSEGAGPALTVQIDPASWFTTSSGEVMDLSAFDYDQTGELLEFELEMEEGIGALSVEMAFDD